MQNEINFQGTFMRDEPLPSYGSFILNLDTFSGSGTHWTAVHCDKRLFYDPFGLPPPIELGNHNIKSYNTIQHQSIDSALCGLYCCYVIKLLNRGRTFHDICYNIIKYKNLNKTNHVQLRNLLCQM